MIDAAILSEKYLDLLYICDMFLEGQESVEYDDSNYLLDHAALLFNQFKKDHDL